MSKILLKSTSLLLTFIMGLTLVACTSAPTATNSNITTADSSANITSVETTAITTAALEPVTIHLMTHYNNADEKAPVDAAIAQLKIDMPNVTIVPEGYVNDSNATFKARIASGDLPDIFEITSVDVLDLLLATQQTVPLDSYITNNDLQSKMQPWTWENSMTYKDGHIYTLPSYSNMNGLLYYNKALFSQYNVKIPTNFDELLSAVKIFNDNGIVPIAMAGKLPFINGALFDMFAQRVNPEGIRGLQTGSAQAADYTEAANRIAELYAADAFEKGVATVDYDPARAMFHSGTAAMHINGDWEITEGQESLGSDLGYVTLFPVLDAGADYTNELAIPGGNYPGPDGVNGLAMSAKTTNPDVTAEVLLKYYELVQSYSFTNNQSIVTAIKTDGLTPINPLPELAAKYLTEKVSFATVGSCWEHSLTNTKLQTGLADELQKLMAGENPAEFITNLNEIVASQNN